MQTREGNTLVLLLGGLALIFAVLAGYFYLLSQPPHIVPVINNSTTKPLDDMANWKTYSNVKYGIEFKHPPMMITVNENQYNLTLDNKTSGTNLITIHESDLTESIEEYIQQTYDGINYSAVKTSFNSFPAYLAEPKSKVEWATNSSYLVKINNKLITISYEQDAKNDNPLISQILSTFRFK